VDDDQRIRAEELPLQHPTGDRLKVDELELQSQQILWPQGRYARMIRHKALPSQAVPISADPRSDQHCSE
jgi:hypothetical protein